MNSLLINDIKKFVNEILMPLDTLYYHQYDHSLSVMKRAIYLAENEKCSEHEIELIAIAAMFHDTGFAVQYDENEQYGARIAREYLEKNDYNTSDIETIESLILATNPNQDPHNLWQKIIKDADMDNLWRKDFFDVNEKLKHEREIIKNIKINDPDWYHASLWIIEWHQFYTSTQIRERNNELQKNIERLKLKLQK